MKLFKPLISFYCLIIIPNVFAQIPQPQIISPNGNEILNANTSQIIWFDRPDTINIDLLFSSDNGSTWSNIISNYDWREGNYFYWLTPDIISNHCVIKIQSSNDSSQFDLSDSSFTISKDTSLKILISSSVMGYFPLTVGNVWEFAHYEKDYVRSILIASKDTLLSDSLEYTKIDRYDRGGNILFPDTFSLTQIGYYFLRNDSTGVYQFPYKKILDFNWVEGDSGSDFIVSSVYYPKIFDKSFRTYIIEFNEYESIAYMDKIGFSTLRNADYGVNENRFLIAAKINGKTYGNFIEPVFH
ncbi:MAG: hypothetical protein ABI550_00890 [Ignavibacteriaceae bacterium]